MGTIMGITVTLILGTILTLVKMAGIVSTMFLAIYLALRASGLRMKIHISFYRD